MSTPEPLSAKRVWPPAVTSRPRARITTTDGATFRAGVGIAGPHRDRRGPGYGFERRGQTDPRARPGSSCGAKTSSTSRPRPTAHDRAVPAEDGGAAPRRTARLHPADRNPGDEITAVSCEVAGAAAMSPVPTTCSTAESRATSVRAPPPPPSPQAAASVAGLDAAPLVFKAMAELTARHIVCGLSGECGLVGEDRLVEDVPGAAATFCAETPGRRPGLPD